MRYTAYADDAMSMADAFRANRVRHADTSCNAYETLCFKVCSQRSGRSDERLILHTGRVITGSSLMTLRSCQRMSSPCTLMFADFMGAWSMRRSYQFRGWAGEYRYFSGAMRCETSRHYFSNATVHCRRPCSGRYTAIIPFFSCFTHSEMAVTCSHSFAIRSPLRLDAISFIELRVL